MEEVGSGRSKWTERGGEEGGEGRGGRETREEMTGVVSRWRLGWRRVRSRAREVEGWPACAVGWVSTGAAREEEEERTEDDGCGGVGRAEG